MVEVEQVRHQRGKFRRSVMFASSRVADLLEKFQEHVEQNVGGFFLSEFPMKALLEEYVERFLRSGIECLVDDIPKPFVVGSETLQQGSA